MTMTARDEIVTAYRRVFGGPQGRVVLNHMLGELYYYSETDTPDQQALNNYAKRLLSRCGILDEVNVKRIAGKLMELPVNFENDIDKLKTRKESNG